MAAALAFAVGAPALADAQVPQVPVPQVPQVPVPQVPAPQVPDVPVPQVPTPSLPAPTPQTPSLPAPPPPVPPVPAPQPPAAPSLPSPSSPAPTVPSAPSLPSPGGISPGVPTPSGSGAGTVVSGASGPGSPAGGGGSGTRAGAAGAERPGRAGASESSTPSGAAGPEAQVLDAVAQVAAVCRAAGRLLAAGVGGPGSAPASFSSAAAEPVGAMAVSLLVGEHGLVRPAGGDLPRAGDGAGDPASVVAGLVDLTPRDVSVLAAVAVGMLLLAVTALAAYALADGPTVPRRRTLLGGVRAALHDPVRRADAQAVLLLVVVSLAIWSAIAIWLLTRGG